MWNKMQRTVLEALESSTVLVVNCPRMAGKSYLVRKLNTRYNMLYYNGLSTSKKINRVGGFGKKLLVVEEPLLDKCNSIDMFVRAGYKVLVIGTGIPKSSCRDGWTYLNLTSGDLSWDYYDMGVAHMRERHFISARTFQC